MMKVHPILLLDLYPTDQRLLLHRCHTVFATVSWHYALKSGSMSPPVLLFFFKNVLVMLNLLHFHINFGMWLFLQKSQLGFYSDGIKSVYHHFIFWSMNVGCLSIYLSLFQQLFYTVFSIQSYTFLKKNLYLSTAFLLLLL